MIRYVRLALLLLFLLLVACDGEFLGSGATSTSAAVAATVTVPAEPASDTPVEDEPTPVAPTPEPSEEASPTATAPMPTATAPLPTATAAADSSTPPPPTATLEAIADQPTPTDQCLLTVLDNTTAYNLPSVEAAVFSTLSPGMPVRAGGVTAEGWIGFDPGVAQAPNVGPFRQRWVPTGPGIVLEGGTCDQLPIVEGPPPGVCFAMMPLGAMVWAEPAAESVMVVPLPGEAYAQAVGRSGSDWILVDLSLGNVGVDQQGWIPMEAISGLNGHCENLPEMSTSS